MLTTLEQPWRRQLGVRTELDVGANAGYFAPHVFPDARVYAFEPLADPVEAMRLRMRGIEAFHAFASAIGDRDGRITIHQSASSSSSSIRPMTGAHTEAFPWTAEEAEVEVDIHRLDHFLPELRLEQKVLLKIEVQGYSLPVLHGAPESIAQTDLLIVETSAVPLYEGEVTFDAVYRHLTDAGFAFIGVLDQLTHPGTDALLQMDAMFRRNQAER